MSLGEASPARGARVELALDAALRGQLARAVGTVAGMSAAERAEFGPLIVAVLRHDAPAAADAVDAWLAGRR
jgi:hypothetical protein